MSNGRNQFPHDRRDGRTDPGRSGSTDGYDELKTKLENAQLFVLASKPAGEPAGGSAGELARKAPNKELFDAIARDYAYHIRKGKNGLRDNTQLRRWFNAVDELNNKAVRGVLSPAHIQAEMALLRARIAYASQRPGVKVPRELVDFVTIVSKKVNDADDLLVFRCLFECVVAYHRAQRNQEGEQ